MTTSPDAVSKFYVVGGTMLPNAQSYIEREADRELSEHVMAGDVCYVLTSRQMGKSSLMARAAERLRARDIHVAVVDLTRIGTEKEEASANKWYYGVAYRILRELRVPAKAYAVASGAISISSVAG